MECVPNPNAAGNIRHGKMVFRKGITDPIEVYKAHLWWNRGAAADYHFERGYIEAALEVGFNATDALRLFSPLISDDDRNVRRQLTMSSHEFPCPY